MAMAPEQRKARDAERKRNSRAAAAALRSAGRPAKTDAADAAVPTTQRDAVSSALAAMKWLVASDDAAVAQARALAEDVDVLRHEREISKSITAQRALLSVLHELGGTPTVRMQHELRSLKTAGRTEGSDGDKNGGKPAEGSNVTKFERPPKRTRTS